MWGALILMCSLDSNQCEQVAKGGLFGTEQECQTDIVELGVPYVLETYTDFVPVDAACFYWSLAEPKT